jgi:hypothetical protein
LREALQKDESGPHDSDSASAANAFGDFQPEVCISVYSERKKIFARLAAAVPIDEMLSSFRAWKKSFSDEL